MSIATPSIQDNGLPALVIRPEEIHQPFPLTDLQNAYWSGRSAAFEPGRVAAHAYFEFESAETLDAGRLTETWRLLIARHGMLRAIVRADGQQQILERVPPYEIHVLDLRGKEPQAAEAESLAVRERLSHRTRPTDRWPLFDVLATRLPGNRLRVHLSIDLLLVDFTSIGILLEEWAALYANPDVALPDIDISFRDYVLANAALEGSAPFETSKAYWLKRLPALAPPPKLPATKAKDVSSTSRFVCHQGRLEADAWQKFKDHAADEDLTPSSALLAVFALVIGTWSKNQRFTLDLTVLNRIPFHPHVNRLVGDFASNTLLPVEQLVEGSFADFGGRLQEQVFQDMEHRYFSGVRVLREWARMHRGTPRLLTPIVFTSAVGDPGPGEEDSPWQWLGKMIYAVSQTPQASLDHSLYTDDGALIFNWDVAEGLFPAGMVEEMFGVYEKLLRRLGDEQEIWQKPTRELLRVLLPDTQIELGEIEAALTHHPRVRTAQGKTRTNKRMVAYIVPAGSEAGHGRSSTSAPVDVFHREDESDYGAGVITDPIKRLEFKAKQPGLRHDNSDTYIQLLKPPADDFAKKIYAGRCSKRRFLREPIAFEKFSNFLNALGELGLDSLPKYRYGSAGGIYPVQLYLYIKPNRIQGLEEGAYYYHPQQHRLIVISRKVTIDQHMHFPVNQELFGKSAFSLFLVAQFDAIKPLYGASSRDFCLLEAGLMTQLLESSAAENQLGICQIGKLKHDTLKDLFKLKETHAVLHSMVGGTPSSDAFLLPVVKRSTAAARSKGSLISEARQFVQNWTKRPLFIFSAMAFRLCQSITHHF